MKSLSFAALAVLLMMHQAEAQTANSGSSSNSSSGSTSGAASSSGSTSNSGASSNQQRTRQNATNTSNTPITFNSTTPDRITTNGSGTFTNNTNNSGFTSSDVTVRTTPTVYAPPVSGGNPCTLAVSGGVSVIGWGAAAGGTFVDEDCANRQKIAMIHNAGYAAAARELMCNDKATYYAFRGTATPCAPRAAFDGPAAPPTMVQQQPGPVVVTPAAPPPIQRTTSAPSRRCTGPNDQGPCVQGS